MRKWQTSIDSHVAEDCQDKQNDSKICADSQQHHRALQLGYKRELKGHILICNFAHWKVLFNTEHMVSVPKNLICHCSPVFLSSA